MLIQSIGCRSVFEPGYSFSSPGQPGSFLLIFSHSPFILSYGGTRSRLPSATFAIFDGSAPVEYSSGEGYLTMDWLTFSAEDDSDLIESLGLTLNEPVRSTDPELTGQLFRNIAEEFYSLSSRRIKVLDLLMRTLLMKLGESCAGREEIQQTTDPHYNALIELREKIYRNPQMKWNVDTMAADVSMSRSYFQHIYREVFGVSCMTDVISGKIEKAKEILSETACTVSQVAAMCGYENEEHFMRQFKKIVGVTPTGYRKKGAV